MTLVSCMCITTSVLQEPDLATHTPREKDSVEEKESASLATPDQSKPHFETLAQAIAVLEKNSDPQSSQALAMLLSLKGAEISTPEAQIGRKLSFSGLTTPSPAKGPDVGVSVSDSALKKRVERMMKPRCDGSYIVPKELVEQWQKGDHTQIMADFKNCQLDKDP